MRIISGRFKGRKLVEFKAQHIRPTTDRVKESLFNIIQNEISGARVLDLFSGTGNLGLEALSRGAISVTFVEESGLSLSILKKNISLLGVDSEVEIVRNDVFKYLKNATGGFNLVLIDPPFTESWADEVMKAISQSAVLMPSALIAIESAKKEPILDQYPDLDLLDRRPFGDKSLSLFRKRGS